MRGIGLGRGVISCALAMLALWAAAGAALGAPTNTSPPQISGQARIGETLSASTGGWSASGQIDYAYQWEYLSGAEPCEPGEDGCEGEIRYIWSPVDDADQPSLVVPADLIMVQVRVVVTAEADGEQAVAASAPAGPVLGAAAANITPPSLNGLAQQGEVLEASPGLWEGADLQFGYSWERSNADDTDWLPILDAFGDQYAVRSEDAGRRIRVRVLATNDGGTVSALSAPTDVVPAGAPVNTSAPAFSAPPTSLHPAQVSPGGWSGTAPISFDYRWQRDQPAGSGDGWEDVSVEAVYTPSAAEVGHRLRLIVTATNAAGAASASSSASEPVSDGPPANLEPPEISGGLADGQLLSAAAGTWLGASGFSYRWQRDQPVGSGSGWQSIAGADQPQYRLGVDDVDHQLRVLVRAWNGAGETEVASEAVLAAPAPVNLEQAPTIGTPVCGEPIVASPGTWSGSAPIAYSYQWQSDQGGAWSDIAGADQASFTPDEALIGARLRVIVTAANAAGSASHISEASAAVTPAPPSIISAPTIAGVGDPFVAIDGARLVASAGVWNAPGTVSYSWAWEREDLLGGWSAIAGAADGEYQLQSADVGRRVRAVQIADNEAPGVVAAPSAPSETVLALPVAPLAAPQLTGDAVDQGQLTVGSSEWVGSTPLTLSYRWQMDDPAGGNDWVDLDGEDQDTIVLGPALIGHRLRAVVSAANAAGTADQVSFPSSVIAAAPPLDTLAPQLVGTARDGQLLEVVAGSWGGSAPITFGYRWEREVEGAWQTIAGESGSSYIIRSQDIGYRLRAVQSAANAAGAAESASTPSAPVSAAPLALLDAPVLSGTARDGEVLSVSSGSFSGSLPIVVEYRWQRDQPAGSGSGWQDLPGSQSSLQLGPAHVGHRLRALVIAENAAGTLEAVSNEVLIAAAPPLNTFAVSIDGQAGVGLELVADPGQWAGTAPLSFRYQWLVDDGVGGWSAIAGADADRFTPGDAYVGLSVRVRVSATNSAGETESQSAPTPALAGRPSASTPPVLSGAAVEGQTLSASSGDWDGDPFPTIQIIWQRDGDGSGAGWTSIDGASGTSYRLTTADIGRRVRAVALASNGFPGGASAASAASAPISGQAPLSTQAPDTSGDPTEGQTLSGTPGSWSGTQPIAYAYQWQRLIDGVWSDIAGATQDTYPLVLADVGASVRLRVVASNVAGEASADSAAVAVPMPAQVIPGAPRLSLVGDRLSAAVSGNGYQDGAAALEARINAVWQTVFQTPALSGETILAVPSAQVGAGPVRVRLTDRYGRQWLSEELVAPVETPASPFVPPATTPPSDSNPPGTRAPDDETPEGGRLVLDVAATLLQGGASASARPPGVRLTIAYGERARIVVRLIGADGAPRAGQPVSLFQGTRFLTSAATNADGRVTLGAPLTRPGDLSAVWSASVRESDRLSVPTTLSYLVTSSVRRSGATMRVSGQLSPAPSLLAARYLPRVRLERLNTAARGCETPTRAPARCWSGIGAARPVSARGAFALSVRRSPSSRYRLRVRVLAPAGSSLGGATGAPVRSR